MLLLLLLQEEEVWHASYHQLRHFKQLHHHLNVPASPQSHDSAAALDQKVERGSSSSSSSDSQWEGLADWLQQQRQLMAASDKLAVHLQQQQQQQAKTGPGSGARLSSLQIRMLKALGV
jgi:hypothetical protein